MIATGLITFMLLHFDDYTLASPFDDEQTCSRHLLRHHLAYQGDEDYLFGQCVTTGAPSRSVLPEARP